MADLIGHQKPRYVWVPPHLSSAGTEAVELAALAGLYLDPWQQYVLDGALAENKSHEWTCFEVCLIVSRQNGKGSILEALELAGLFLFGDRLIIHSAHRFITSKEHFLRIQALIQSCPELDREVKRFTQSHGEEAVELNTGQRLKFMARTGSSGRGFTGDRIIFDEAMYLDAMQMAAMLPTLSTRPNAQVWYTGSAGMKHSDQLAMLRRRGIEGGDPSLAFFEWSIDERPVDEGGDDRLHPQSWAKANPGMGIRIPQSYIEKEMAAMGGPNSLTFGMERLGVGDWPDEDEAWAIVKKNQWEGLTEFDSQIRGPLAFGVDADRDRDQGVVSAVGANADGRLHYEVAHRQPGTSWIADWLIERVKTWEPCAVVILPTSPAASIIARLEEAKIKVISPSLAEYTQSCGAFYEDVAETGHAVHIGQAALGRALGGARKKDVGEGSWVWSRKEVSVDIAPLVAVTLARYGFASFGHQKREPLGAFSTTSIMKAVDPADRAPEKSLHPFGGYLPETGSTGLAGVRRGSSGAYAAAKRGES